MEDERKISDSSARFYEGVRLTTGVTGKSSVARLLNVSNQTLNNWELREVSYDGAVISEEMFGLSPLWIKTGRGEMMAGRSSPTHFPSEEAMMIAKLYDQSDRMGRIGVWLSLKSAMAGNGLDDDNMQEIVKHITKL